jgi:hypothetical protein
MERVKSPSERVRCSEIDSYACKIKCLDTGSDFLLDKMLDAMLDVFQADSGMLNACE